VKGDEAHHRFGEVVLPHLQDGLALARWLVASRHDAEDIVQDACLRALAAIGSYDGRGSRAWFLTIVRNTSFTWLTKNRPKDLVQVGDMSELDAYAPSTVDGGEASNPEAVLMRKLEDAAVEGAIARLPHTFREIVVLRDVNGLSYKEISAMLTVPIGTVMSRLARGRGLLLADIERGAR
jgi:RNA polymerase sigma factor (sigma-70 family)